MSMDIKGIKELINDHVELISVSSQSIANARELSGKFLMAQALLTSFLKDFEDDKSKLITLKEMQYATAIQNVEGKNVTEKKINVALNADYTSAREAYEQIDAIRDYIKTHMKIFENAHLMYRQYGRD